jgi:hypothetical protein
MRSYIIIFVFALLGTACEPVMESRADKHFAEAKLTFIKTKYGDVKIKIPSCFEEIDDYDFSLTNEHKYDCDEFRIYMSIDVLTHKDVARFTSKNNNTAGDLLDYLGALRASEFYDMSNGIVIRSDKKGSCATYRLLQYGKYNYQDEDLVFWYSGIQCEDYYYVIQLICLKEEFNNYEKHLKRTMNSFEVI